jgi:hypothetical protein
MINNLNPKMNPVTTLLGLLLIVISVGMLIVPIFYEVKESLSYWIPGSIGIVGLCLLLIPDDLKGALKKLVNRKSEEI